MTSESRPDLGNSPRFPDFSVKKHELNCVQHKVCCSVKADLRSATLEAIARAPPQPRSLNQRPGLALLFDAFSLSFAGIHFPRLPGAGANPLVRRNEALLRSPAHSRFSTNALTECNSQGMLLHSDQSACAALRFEGRAGWINVLWPRS